MAAAFGDLDDIVRLEERAFSAWPAPQTIYYGGWVFRLAGGFTKRANSANALGVRDAVTARYTAEITRREREREGGQQTHIAALSTSTTAPLVTPHDMRETSLPPL